MRRLFFVSVVALLLMATAITGHSARAQDETFIKVANDPALGAILTDAKGMTLYLFTPDTTANSSNCADKCAENWPPLAPADGMSLPDGVPGELTAFDRADGTQQVAYNGIPLYYWVKDAAAGDTTGQAVGGVWFVVSPGSELGEYAAAPGEGTPVPSSTLKIGFTSELGPFLTDANGMTLYLFTKDTVAGESTCYDKCEENWPIMPATDADLLPAGIQGALSIVTRTDGTTMLAYNDIPLYYFAGDAAAGDTNGQEVGDVWYVVTPGMKLGDPPHESEDAGTPEA